MVVNYGLEKVRFPAPVPVGKQVRLTASVAEVTEIKGAIQLVADAVIEGRFHETRLRSASGVPVLSCDLTIVSPSEERGERV